jgi:hypothetical protein
MSEFGEQLAKHVSELINTLDELKKECPEKYFRTPYETLHYRLQMALESFKNASTNRLPHALQKPPQDSQDDRSGGR